MCSRAVASPPEGVVVQTPRSAAQTPRSAPQTPRSAPSPGVASLLCNLDEAELRLRDASVSSYPNPQQYSLEGMDLSTPDSSRLVQLFPSTVPSPAVTSTGHDESSEMQGESGMAVAAKEVAPQLLRLWKEVHGDNPEASGFTLVEILRVLARSENRQLSSLIFEAFQNQMHTHKGLKPQFTRIVSLREHQFGHNDPRTTQARLAFIIGIFDTQQRFEDAESARSGRQALEQTLDRTKDLLHSILRTAFSEDTTQALLPSRLQSEHDLDNSLKHTSLLWDKHEVLETFINTSEQHPFFMDALFSTVRYQEQLEDYRLARTVENFIRMGYIIERRVSIVCVLVNIGILICLFRMNMISWILNLPIYYYHYLITRFPV